MFNDPLTLEKSTQLIDQLGQTSFPFICAHGRPSICPLARLLSQSASTRPQAMDWTGIFVPKAEGNQFSTVDRECCAREGDPVRQ